MSITLRTWALRIWLGSPGAQPTPGRGHLPRARAEDATLRGLPIRRPARAGYRAATYPLLSDVGQLRSENLLVVGEHQLIQEAFTTGSGKYYIGYGVWRCLTHGRRKQPQLTLRMDNTSQVAPLPVDISGATLSRWRYWRQSQPRPVT
ncbi:hypothetical protein [Nocardia sp. NBC_01329]|uniref:hypothetical protein n=1 Tax=Nocardia sp. NBC_01329 TaxID=2903594 RepID=UPI002E0F4F76|nr:hypothetical protein OG405_13235 [Nocardia sp. NBC_01329]